jgi:hypothetical protein
MKCLTRVVRVEWYERAGMSVSQVLYEISKGHGLSITAGPPRPL